MNNKIYRLCGNIVIESVCGAPLLIRTGDVPGKKGKVLPLNNAGAYFVRLLDGKRTITELAQEAAGHYEIEADKAETDMEHFIGKLWELGYVDEV